MRSRQYAVGSTQNFRRSRGSLCILPTAFCLLLVGCSSGPSAPDSASYVESLAAARAFKDQDFRENPESPVPADKKTTLLPLQYFPIDPAYRVPAALNLAEQRPVFEMPTSTGKPRRMQLVGTLEFTFQGQSHSLGAFVPEGTQQIVDLFVPFADVTTGTDTYPAGRYLDLTPTSTGFYTIDFNQAYNPYCAYNASYECPFPPPSNRLKVAIQAGEKLPGA
ncbi:MAG: DUF1684 domain-containing protein [Acidimicrobiia bacterium]|nr:DUF1684 domain-containing protein [Acidimicrobiia bacterium]